MAIQMRRGNNAYYDESKMKPGEVAVATDTRQAYVGMGNGDAEELAFKRDLEGLGDGGGGGTTDHNALINREVADQHPISAITGLQEALDAAGGSGGTTDHEQLTNRDAADQHPISAITGLPEQLLRPGVNLLHNADWAYSLVNQRGHSGAVSNDYCIDRWIGNGTVTPVAGQYVTLASGTTMTQKMEIIPEALFGKEVTFSIDIYGSTQTETISFPVSADAPANIAYVSCGTIELGFVSGSFRLCGVTCDAVPYIKFTASSSVNVYRVFLEIGKVSHIAETPSQDYINNVLVCKRYFYRNNELSDRLVFGYYSSSSTLFAFPFPPTNMRMRPSVAIQGFGIFRGVDGYTTENGNDGDDLTEFTFDVVNYGIFIRSPLAFSAKNNTPGTLVFSTNSHMDLSADL